MLFAEIVIIISQCFAEVGNIRNSHQPPMNIYEKEAAFVSIYYYFFFTLFLNRFVLFTSLVEANETVVRTVLPTSLACTSGKAQTLCSGVQADVQLLLSWFSCDLSPMWVRLPEDSSQTTQ